MVEKIESPRLVIRCWRPEDAVQTLATRLGAVCERFVGGDDWGYAVFESRRRRP
jgi:hypothetical protein